MTPPELLAHDGSHDCYGRLWDGAQILRFGECPYRAGYRAARRQEGHVKVVEAAVAYWGCEHDDDARCEHWKALGAAIEEYEDR
jgi:hypothetical protein